jgi:hypothetical protein
LSVFRSTLPDVRHVTPSQVLVVRQPTAAAAARREGVSTRTSRTHEEQDMTRPDSHRRSWLRRVLGGLGATVAMTAALLIPTASPALALGDCTIVNDINGSATVHSTYVSSRTVDLSLNAVTSGTGCQSAGSTRYIARFTNQNGVQVASIDSLYTPYAPNSFTRTVNVGSATTTQMSYHTTSLKVTFSVYTYTRGAWTLYDDSQFFIINVPVSHFDSSTGEGMWGIGDSCPQHVTGSWC